MGITFERSGRVRDAFIEAGHDAVSCDLEDTDSPGPHIKGDVFDQDWRDFDLLICHPPCTYLCNSGVRWLWNADGSPNQERWKLMRKGAMVFAACFGLAACPMAVEQPIMHRHAMEIVTALIHNQRPSQTVQPWHFGDGETKATCLWLRGLPPLDCDAPLYATPRMVSGRAQRVHLLPPSPDRARLRSITPLGVARAMAEQWGSLPLTSTKDHP